MIMTAKQTKKKCLIDTCEKISFSRGYCRRHYGKLWRMGCVGAGIVHSTALEMEEERRELSPNENELVSYLRQLGNARRVAKENYDNVVGFQGRMYWRRKIEEIEAEIERYENQQIQGVLRSNRGGKGSRGGKS